jgi:hypothetical protein
MKIEKVEIHSRKEEDGGFVKTVIVRDDGQTFETCYYDIFCPNFIDHEEKHESLGGFSINDVLAVIKNA